MTEGERRDKRYPAPPGVHVRCESWDEFVQYYATDVSQGGMFIATNEPPELLSEVEVQLELPEGHEVLLRATVVHVLDVEQAAREHKQAGVGVHFVDLDKVHKEQIHQLVEFARWEGAAGQSRATLASRMFEAAASIPPSKVFEALPPEPAEASARAARPSSGVPQEPAAGMGRAPAARSAPPTRAASSRSSGRHPAVDVPGDLPAAEPEPSAPPKSAADPALIRLGVTHFARRRYEEAISTFERAVKEAPPDREAQVWLHRARAQFAQKQGQDQAAAEHYQKLLEIDEANAEARKFVREFHSKQRLNALPFGRYFVKKP